MPMRDDGPFTDDMIRGILQVHKMQHEIIPHIEEMAQKLAAAGVASFMVTGDAPDYAVTRWVDVLRDRALELVREKMPDKKTRTQSMIETTQLERQKLLEDK